MFSGKKRREVVNNYNLSVKPALESLGFEGESGYVTEDVDFLDTLYYLKNPDKLLRDELNQYEKERLQKYSSLVNDGYISDEEEVFKKAEGNYYTIAFMAICNNDYQKGVFEVSGNGNDKEKWGKFGAPLFEIVAPISLFHKTNLKLFIQRAFMSIEDIEEGSERNPFLLVNELTIDSHNDLICGLPSIFPMKPDVNKKRLKQAQKFFKDGYLL